MKIYLISIIVALSVLAGCQSKVEKESLWGVYQEPIKAGSLPKDTGAEEIQTLWKKDIGAGAALGYALLKPAYYGRHLYVSNRSGGIFCFDSATGATLWENNLGTPIYAAVSAGENLVVAASDSGVVFALDSNDGAMRWRSAIRRQISAIPVVGKGRVLVRTADGLIIGLDSRTGETAWQLEKAAPGLSLHGDSTPVITGDAVLVGLSSGRLIANDVVNGRDYWETSLSYVKGQNELERISDSDAAPIVRGATVYAAAYQGSVVALQLQNAEVIWRAKVSTRLPMAIAQDQLFVTGELGEVVALSLDDGSTLWEQPAFRGHGVSQPIVQGGRVIVGDAEGNIHTLDIDSGSLIETREVVSGAVAAMVQGDGQFTVFSSAGSLSTLSLSPAL